MRDGLINEASLKKALLDARGDIFLAASVLDCTPAELDRYVRASAELQQFAAAIETVKVDPAYSQMSTGQFEKEIASLTQAYRLVGLEELHKLATMDPAGSAAMAKVKLQAAISLRGGEQVRTDGDIDRALVELNQLYHQNAPRIREIRQTVICLEGSPAEIQPVIESGQDLL